MYEDHPMRRKFLKARQHRFKGWLEASAFNNIVNLLIAQHEDGVTGDILEIGTYKGKTASVLAVALRPGEKLYLVDLFDKLPANGSQGSDTEEHEKRSAAWWDANPAFTEAQLISTLCSAMGEELRPFLVTVKTDSKYLTLPGPFRFIHVDGCHTYEMAKHDIEYAITHLVPEGVVAVDDWNHREWVDVTRAVKDVVKEHSNLKLVTDQTKAYISFV